MISRKAVTRFRGSCPGATDPADYDAAMKRVGRIRPTRFVVSSGSTTWLAGARKTIHAARYACKKVGSQGIVCVPDAARTSIPASTGATLEIDTSPLHGT